MLEDAEYRRVLAIGDIHGEYDRFVSPGRPFPVDDRPVENQGIGEHADGVKQNNREYQHVPYVIQIHVSAF